MSWIVGQRVYAEYEPELGLGIVVEIIHSRQIKVLFPAAEETRIYARQSAPLRRFVLAIGQRGKSKKGEVFVVRKVEEEGGLYRYADSKVRVWEYELDAVIEDKGPIQQLLAGQWDSPAAFDLRQKAWRVFGEYAKSPLKGLFGPRVSLLPHQFFIAHTLSGRVSPRALLADEVGLGKTIEAGLVFSALRAQGRANRVLVLVPEALKHQWLAELYRRFNDTFSTLDVDRSEAERASTGMSAFRANQKLICSIEFLIDHPEYLEEALEEPWDLVIVDEAHHLQWMTEDSSAEWECVRLFSGVTQGLLLLTATPEHRGLDTQYGLLHLVDPDRFSSYDRFLEDVKGAQSIATLAEQLADGKPEKKFLKELKQAFPDDAPLHGLVDNFEKSKNSDAVLKALIDRHGTGRVYVRNRRNRLRGFPERQLVEHPLESSDWDACLGVLAESRMEDDEAMALGMGKPKLVTKQGYPVWFVARCRWLLTLLQSLGKAKVLLICSNAKRTEEIQEWLRHSSPIKTGVFHELMEIVERDRQAAWFSGPEGAQILLCSEIGGEGRNFQFASHLVLFDLPNHPDILEQRIGRLDRIGQKETIRIHVPYFRNSPEEVLFRCYKEAVQSFSRPWNGGLGEDEFQALVVPTIRSYLPKSKKHSERTKRLKTLLAKLADLVEGIRERQAKSVDVLVDMNSFDEASGTALVSDVAKRDYEALLSDFLESTFDLFGVEIEPMDRVTQRASIHSLSFVEHFPGIRDQVTFTYDRATALAREDVALMTLDHPIVQGALSLLLEGQRGQTSGLLMDGHGDAMFEVLYVYRPVAPAYLNVALDFPVQALKLYYDLEGKILDRPPEIPTDRSHARPIPPSRAAKLMERARTILPPILERSEAECRKRLKPRVHEAVRKRQARCGLELDRLRSLSEINHLVKRKEIDTLSAWMEHGVDAIESIAPQLDAIRLIAFSSSIELAATRSSEN